MLNIFTKQLGNLTGFAVVIILLLINCTLIPANSLLYIDLKDRVFISLSAIVGFFVLKSVLKRSRLIAFGLYDVLFLSFIMLIMLSQFWARNPIDSVSVAFSWFFYYCVFKFFQDWNLQNTRSKYFPILLQAILFFNLLIVVYHFFQKGFSIDNFTLQFAKQQISELSATLKLHRNHIATYLVLLGVIPFYYLSNSKQKYKLIFSFLALFLLALSLFLIRSRGGLLTISTLLILSGSYVIYKKQTSWYIFPILLIVWYASFEFVSFFQESEKNYLFLLNPFYGFDSEYGDERLHLWKITMQLFIERPIFGFGSGSWLYEYMKFGVGDFRQIDYTDTYFKSTHNVPLNILFCNGIAGFCFFLSLTVFYPVYISLVDYHSNAVSKNTKIGLIGILASLIMMQFYGNFDIKGGYLLGGPFMLFMFLGLVIKNKNYKYQAIIYLLVIAGGLSSIYFYQNTKINMVNWSYFHKLLKKDSYKGCKLAINNIENTLVGFSYFGYTTDYLNFKLMRKGQDTNEALSYLERVINKDPYNFILWYEAGIENEKLGFYNKAITCFENALLYNCDYIKAKVKLYCMHSLTGNFMKAKLLKNELYELEAYLKRYNANEEQLKNYPKAVRKKNHYQILFNTIQKFEEKQGKAFKPKVQ